MTSCVHFSLFVGLVADASRSRMDGSAQAQLCELRVLGLIESVSESIILPGHCQGLNIEKRLFLMCFSRVEDDQLECVRRGNATSLVAAILEVKRIGKIIFGRGLDLQ